MRERPHQARAPAFEFGLQGLQGAARWQANRSGVEIDAIGIELALDRGQAGLVVGLCIGVGHSTIVRGSPDAARGGMIADVNGDDVIEAVEAMRQTLSPLRAGLVGARG